MSHLATAVVSWVTAFILAIAGHGAEVPSYLSAVIGAIAVVEYMRGLDALGALRRQR